MAVRAALAEVRSVWCSVGIAAGVRDMGEQVLAEVLNNVVEHAQAGRPDGTVQLETTGTVDGLSCVVHDDGVPMPEEKLPAGEPAPIGDRIESLPEGGFGWFMIRTLTRDLSYERQGGWNRLQFRICGDDLAALD